MYLVRSDGVKYPWHASKPFYVLRLSILEPSSFIGHKLIGRLYCTSKAMWKLGWFLRDFLYDQELFSADQVDERALHGPVGVVKVSHTVVNGVSLVHFDTFAPAGQWEQVRTIAVQPAVELDGLRAPVKTGVRE
jgi:hypothetical protein